MTAVLVALGIAAVIGTAAAARAEHRGKPRRQDDGDWFDWGDDGDGGDGGDGGGDGGGD